MAKKQKVNKTKTVADYLKSHHGATSSEIAEALGKQGIKITPAHVANIKSKIKRIRSERKAAAKPDAAAPAAMAAELAAATEKMTPAGTIALAHVKAVAQTVQAMGGCDRLNELLGVIREVGGMKKFKDLMDAMAMTDAAKP